MDIKDAIEEGIASDLLKSQRYYFIYRSIGEHYHLLENIKSRPELSMLSFLQASSQDLCVLHLAKIYDKLKTRSKYKIRSLHGLLEENFRSESDNIIYLKYLDNLALIQEISGLNLTSEEAISEDQLLEYLKRVLELDLVIAKVNNIKSIRDKYLAHNEYGFKGLDYNAFWDEVKDLQDIAALYLTIIGNHFLNIEYFQFNEIGRNKVHFVLLSDLWWLYEMLEKIIGKEKLVYWWNKEDGENRGILH